jgi:hypothetical protein
MARGAQAKLRRRNRKGDDEEAVIDMFGPKQGGAEATGTSDFDEIPMPPGLASGTTSESPVEADNSEEESNLPKKKKKKKSKPTAKEPLAGTASSAGSTNGIKRTPLILLILMTGTTLLPAFIYAGDYLSAFMAKNHIMGQIGFRMGVGAVPRKRVVSFYEKHSPEKLEEVPNILSKHYGDYPKLIRKLERKYQDYGYFLGWEEDEAPMRLALDQVHAMYETWVTDYWNRYAPQPLKTAARNMRYNFSFLYKKLRKAWKKQVWPHLEPFLGVPDKRAAEKQKRKDAADARKRRAGSSAGTRRKNTDYRDDVEED